MKKSRQLRIKAEGPQPGLADLIEKMEHFYIVVKTSRIIEHREDDLSHVYLTLMEASNQ